MMRLCEKLFTIEHINIHYDVCNLDASQVKDVENNRIAIKKLIKACAADKDVEILKHTFSLLKSKNLATPLKSIVFDQSDDTERIRVPSKERIDQFVKLFTFDNFINCNKTEGYFDLIRAQKPEWKALSDQVLRKPKSYLYHILKSGNEEVIKKWIANNPVPPKIPEPKTEQERQNQHAAGTRARREKTIIGRRNEVTNAVSNAITNQVYDGLLVLLKNVQTEYFESIGDAYDKVLCI